MIKSINFIAVNVPAPALQQKVDRRLMVTLTPPVAYSGGIKIEKL